MTEYLLVVACCGAMHRRVVGKLLKASFNLYTVLKTRSKSNVSTYKTGLSIKSFLFLLYIFAD